MHTWLTYTIHTHTARPANFATYSFLFTDSFLNLTGVFAVEGRALAIHEANRGKEALSGNAVNHNLYVAY